MLDFKSIYDNIFKIKLSLVKKRIGVIMTDMEKKWNDILIDIEKLDIFPTEDLDILRNNIVTNECYYRFIFKADKDLAIKVIDIVFEQIIEDGDYYSFSDYVEYMQNEKYSNNPDKAIEIALACFEIAKDEDDCDGMRDMINYLDENSQETISLFEEAKEICSDDEYEWE